MVFLMLRPAVTGATLPGRERAHTTRTPSSLAASRSTPADVGMGRNQGQQKRKWTSSLPPSCMMTRSTRAASTARLGGEKASRSSTR